MFLSHKTIERLLDEGALIITNFDRKDIRPVGIRVHLAKDILIPESGQAVEISGGAQDLKYREVDVTKEEFFLEPGGFILAATEEAIQTPKNIMAVLDGRSTVARLGLTTHVTASIIDGTFEVPHVPVLEIKNLGNFRVRLKHMDPIGMMLFAELSEPVTQKVHHQYRGSQNKATPPNLEFKPGEDEWS